MNTTKQTRVGVFKIAAGSDGFFTVDGIEFPRLCSVIPLDNNRALVAGDGDSFIVMLGSTVSGSVPSTRAALIAALKLVVMDSGAPQSYVDVTTGPFVNGILEYLVRPTGVKATDDANIATVIALVNAAGHGAIQLAAGNFSYGNPWSAITVPCAVHGAGEGATKLTFEVATTEKAITFAHRTTTRASRLSGLSIFPESALSATVGVAVYGDEDDADDQLYGFGIDKVHIEGFELGIHLQNARNGHVRDTTIIGASGIIVEGVCVAVELNKVTTWGENFAATKTLNAGESVGFMVIPHTYTSGGPGDAGGSLRPEDIKIINPWTLHQDVGIHWSSGYHGLVSGYVLDYCNKFGVIVGNTDGGLTLADGFLAMDGAAAQCGIYVAAKTGFGGRLAVKGLHVELTTDSMLTGGIGGASSAVYVVAGTGNKHTLLEDIIVGSDSSLYQFYRGIWVAADGVVLRNCVVANQIVNTATENFVIEGASSILDCTPNPIGAGVGTGRIKAQSQILTYGIPTADGETGLLYSNSGVVTVST